MKCTHWLVLLSCLSMGMAAQTADQPGEQRRILPGDRVYGKVTAVSSDSVTISPQGGSDPTLKSQTPFTIKVTDTTRINKQSEPIKLNEIKPGDIVFAVGHRDGYTVQATMLGVVPPEMVARMSGSPAARAGLAGQFNQADQGKKFILGTVKAIKGTKLTIVRTDGQTQEIEVDENTSFRKSLESITLPEIKVGDFVMGRGELKNNVFVPRTLNVGPPQPQLPGGAGASSPAQAPPARPKPTKKKDAPPKG